MLTPRRRLGNEGEDAAAAYLAAKGFRVLARQARIPRLGEIDLVALDRGTLVFVEVKTRRDAAYGTPEEAVTPAKLRTLQACAEAWRAERGWFDRPYRIDVVAVELTGSVPRLRHHVAV